MNVKEAVRLANKMKYADNLNEVWEYPDRFVISYCDKNGEVPAVSPVFVMKKDGVTGIFFPPDFDEKFLAKGKKVY